MGISTIQEQRDGEPRTRIGGVESDLTIGIAIINTIRKTTRGDVRINAYTDTCSATDAILVESACCGRREQEDPRQCGHRR